MAKRPGDPFAFQFATKAASGALESADSLPTGTVVRNGVDDGTPVVAVTNLAAGIYKAAGTIPDTYVSGDDVQVRVNSTVAGVTGASLHNFGVLRNYLQPADPIRDVKTATVEGSLAGSWTTGWGKAVKDVVNKLLKVWGPGNDTSTPSATFRLDDPNNPTSRTPN